MTLCSSDLMSKRHKYSRNLGETRAYQKVGSESHKMQGPMISVTWLALQLSGARCDVPSKRKYQLLRQTTPTTKQTAQCLRGLFRFGMQHASHAMCSPRSEWGPEQEKTLRFIQAAVPASPWLGPSDPKESRQLQLCSSREVAGGGPEVAKDRISNSTPGFSFYLEGKMVRDMGLHCRIGGT